MFSISSISTIYHVSQKHIIGLFYDRRRMFKNAYVEPWLTENNLITTYCTFRTNCKQSGNTKSNKT